MFTHFYFQGTKDKFIKKLLTHLSYTVTYFVSPEVAENFSPVHDVGIEFHHHGVGITPNPTNKIKFLRITTISFSFSP
jgi:hypothetical protein